MHTTDRQPHPDQVAALTAELRDLTTRLARFETVPPDEIVAYERRRDAILGEIGG